MVEALGLICLELCLVPRLGAAAAAAEANERGKESTKVAVDGQLHRHVLMRGACRARYELPTSFQMEAAVAGRLGAIVCRGCWGFRTVPAY
jgi:hypothetical protein